MKIQECELALETERQRVAIYQDERDRAIAERCGRSRFESDGAVIRQSVRHA
jgi:hypothetical protein